MWWEVRVELREQFWKTRKMLGCCKEEADRERVGVAACVNLQQPQHLRAKGRTGIPEYLGRNWNSRGDFPPWGIAETGTEQLLGTPEDLVESFSVLTQVHNPLSPTFWARCASELRNMWVLEGNVVHTCILLSPWVGANTAPHYQTLGAFCCETPCVHTGNTQRVLSWGQILPPNERAPNVESLPRFCGSGIAYKGLWIWFSWGISTCIYFFFLALFDTQVFSAAPPIGDDDALCCRYRNTSTLLTTATCRCRPSPAAHRAAPAPAPRLLMTSWSAWLPMSRSMSARTSTRLRPPSKPSIIWWPSSRITVSEWDLCGCALLPRVGSSVTSPRGCLQQGEEGDGECRVQNTPVSVPVTAAGAHTRSTTRVQYLWFCLLEYLKARPWLISPGKNPVCISDKVSKKHITYTW